MSSLGDSVIILDTSEAAHGAASNTAGVITCHGAASNTAGVRGPSRSDHELAIEIEIEEAIARMGELRDIVEKRKKEREAIRAAREEKARLAREEAKRQRREAEQREIEAERERIRALAALRARDSEEERWRDEERKERLRVRGITNYGNTSYIGYARNLGRFTRETWDAAKNRDEAVLIKMVLRHLKLVDPLQQEYTDCHAAMAHQEKDVGPACFINCILCSRVN